MGYYEKCYTTLEEAKQAQKITGGKLTAFWSIDEQNKPILIYCVKFEQLF